MISDLFFNGNAHLKEILMGIRRVSTELSQVSTMIAEEVVSKMEEESINPSQIRSLVRDAVELHQEDEALCFGHTGKKVVQEASRMAREIIRRKRDADTITLSSHKGRNGYHQKSSRRVRFAH